eukprot:c42515_g1_i1 orf=31-240(+)
MDLHVSKVKPYILFFDGSSRGKQCDASIGVVIKNPKNQIIVKMGCYLGKAFTNNMAEYKALLAGLNLYR